MVKKLIIIGIFLLCFVGSYFLMSNIYREPQEIDLDGNFDRVLKEVESYGGGMIVSYDTETGEITGKRRMGEKENIGVMTITEEEYNENTNYPEGSLIASSSLTPRRAVEYGGNN